MSGFWDLLEGHINNTMFQPTYTSFGGGDFGGHGASASYGDETPAAQTPDANQDDKNKGPTAGQRVASGLANAFSGAGSTLAGVKQPPATYNIQQAQQRPGYGIVSPTGGVPATPEQAAVITAPLQQPMPSVQLTPPQQVSPPSAPIYPQYQLGQGPYVYSDENLKTNIQPTNTLDIDQFINSLSPKSFDYIDPKYGSHTEAGTTTKDLKKSKIGQSVVKSTPAGEVVDVAKLAPLLATVFSYKTQQLEKSIADALSKLKGKK